MFGSLIDVAGCQVTWFVTEARCTAVLDGLRLAVARVRVGIIQVAE